MDDQVIEAVDNDPFKVEIVEILYAAPNRLTQVEISEIMYKLKLRELRSIGSWRTILPALLVKLPIALSSGIIYRALYALEEKLIVYGSWVVRDNSRPFDPDLLMPRAYALYPRHKKRWES